jgi:hypothetical protein
LGTEPDGLQKENTAWRITRADSLSLPEFSFPLASGSHCLLG